MKLRSQLYSALAVLTITLILHGCGSHKPSTFKWQPYSQQPRFAKPGALSESSMHDSSSLLKYAGGSINHGHFQQAKLALLNIERQDLNEVELNDFHLLQSAVALHQRHPNQSLAQLDKIDEISLSSEQAIAYYQQLTQTYQQKGKLKHSIAALMALSERAIATSEKLAAQQYVLHQLSYMSPKHIQQAKMDADTRLNKGWTSLVALLNTQMLQPESLWENLQLWHRDFSDHPATLLITSKPAMLPPKSHHVALLLPLKGPLAGPAQAIHDGVMQAYFGAQSQQRSGQFTVKVYDTYQQDINQIYSKATHEGASWVIGPLDKSTINQLLAQSSLDVPTLVLNQPARTRSQHNLLQLSLNPRQEIQQLAHRVWQDGHRRVLVFSPEDSWGKDLIDTFEAHWQQLGGTFSDVMGYKPGQHFNHRIATILGVKKSQQRYRRISRAIAQKPIYYPQRRQDIDAVILIALPRDARQIRPMLKFYYAGNLPTYSISTAYRGHTNTNKDKDLNGLIFCDMPALLLRHKKNASSYSAVDSWPEQLNSPQRLYALGHDAYLLTLQHPLLQQYPLLGLPGNSGLLWLDKYGQVFRQLSWARFQRGRPSLLLG